MFYFQWHITDKCNFRCSHCYQENYTDASDMPLEELKIITNKLFQTLSKWKKKGDVSITGGEPLVRKDLFPFLEYLDSNGVWSQIIAPDHSFYFGKETKPKSVNSNCKSGIQKER